MSLIPSQDRQLIQILCWDPFIDSENPVRLIDAFVDYFDFEQLGFIPRGVHWGGRPAFAKSVLLKLYIYSYLNRIRSSRQLAKACCFNAEVNLIFTCYNLRRAMSIFGMSELISRLKTAFLALPELRVSLMVLGPAIGYSNQEQSERRIVA